MTAMRLTAAQVRDLAQIAHGYSRGEWTGCSCGSVEERISPRDCAQCRHDAE